MYITSICEKDNFIVNHWKGFNSIYWNALGWIDFWNALGKIFG